MHLKKVLAKNRFTIWKIGQVPEKSVFWAKLCLGVLFTFFRPIPRKESFHLISSHMCTFYELKRPKCKQLLNIS
jgi:hypothetical protein